MSTGSPRDQEELAWRETRDSGGAGGQSDDEDLDWIRYLTGGGSGSGSDFSSDEAPRRSVRARFARKSSGESESGGPSENDAGGPAAEPPGRGRARGRPAGPEPEAAAPHREDRGRGHQRRAERHRDERHPADAGRPSRFPARGTMAAGRIRAAAGRSAAAGVPTRVTLCHVRMIRVRPADGVALTRARPTRLRATAGVVPGRIARGSVGLGRRMRAGEVVRERMPSSRRAGCPGSGRT